ncbi:transcriptional regulator (plasmid) [Ketogulonicigenium robustum]|uniref:Transcriptional regulator n=1 Tax=Ketogulonicigenium robustum TaxID=92947 RepID=A0A1W6P3I1_9RHOB|nr:LysR substrate-binding domain-containing protein [Ketogulonicigenium robustum]ARO15910.1 transcriptional regulator [Ketogulonicigenium robustum]
MRRFLPSLSALQAFDSAARQLSFTRAAEDLMLTQSGISRQITNLENYLGVRLFERTGSRLVLTDAGRSYAADVRQTLDRLEEVSIDAVRGRKADTGLVLGAHPTFALRFLLPRLRAFGAAFPATPLEIAALPQNVDPAAIEADIAIMRGSGSWQGTRTREFFAEKLVVVASPAFVARFAPPAGEIDFAHLPTLQNASRPSLWLQWLRMSGVAHQGAIAGLRLPQSQMLIAAAQDGLGLAVLPLHYVADALRDGSLVAPFGPPVASGESYWIVTPESKSHRAALLDVRDWLLREAEGMTRAMAALHEFKS